MGRFTLYVATAGVLLVVAGGWILAEDLEDTSFIPLDHPAIQYTQKPDNDPVSRLDKRLENGQVNFRSRPTAWDIFRQS